MFFLLILRKMVGEISLFRDRKYPNIYIAFSAQVFELPSLTQVARAKVSYVLLLQWVSMLT
jgi:hypothetical protein